MQEWFYKLQNSKNLIAVVGILLVVWLGYNTTRVILRNYDLTKTIEKLNDEIAVLQLVNENLQFEIGYYGTDAFLELEARDKLAKVGPGERLLVLPKNRYKNLIVSNEKINTDDSPPAISNFNEWMDFLIGGTR